MNNKGFMMAELVVVSGIIVVALTTLFISQNKLISSYNKTLNYHDVGTTYRLGHYSRKYSDTINIEKNNWESNTHNKKILLGNSNIYNNTEYKDTLILIKGNSDNISEINNTFKEYLEYFKNSVKTEDGKFYLILESCQNKNDEEKCKYANIEI